MKLMIDMPWERDLSVNHMRYGRGGGYRKKPHVQAWVTRAYWEAFDACGLYWDDMVVPPVRLVVDFRFPDKRRRDDHNYYKVICDAVATGLGIDDQHIRISTGSVTVDRENPGFTITVEDSG